MSGATLTTTKTLSRAIPAHPEGDACHPRDENGNDWGTCDETQRRACVGAWVRACVRVRRSPPRRRTATATAKGVSLCAPVPLSVSASNCVGRERDRYRTLVRTLSALRRSCTRVVVRPLEANTHTRERREEKNGDESG